MLAESTGLSKSGLFAHFSSKEDLQKSVLQQAIEEFMQKVVEPGLRQAAGRKRLKTLYTSYLDWIIGDPLRPGCPFVIFIQEFDDKSGEIRDLLVEAQTAWRELLSESIRKAQKDKQVARTGPAAQIAFELIGAALSFQTSLKLLNDQRAHRRALKAFEHILA